MSFCLYKDGAKSTRRGEIARSDHLAGVEGKREGGATSAGADGRTSTVSQAQEGAEGGEGGVARASGRAEPEAAIGE